MRTLTLLALSSALSFNLSFANEEKSYDVVIIGNSSSNPGAAIGAARLGVKVALVEQTPVLGGMLSNGISNIDCYSYESLSGVFEEFRQAVKKHYEPLEGKDPLLMPAKPRPANHIDGRSHAAHAPLMGGRWEPKVAQQIFKDMVARHPNIDVYYNRIPVSVTVQDNTLKAVKTETAKGEPITFKAKVFIDTTHEGDLAAWSGVDYRVGREARSALEPHAGKVYFFNHTGEFLPGTTGEGDKAIPSYGLRLNIQNYAPEAGDAHVLKNPPPDYNKEKYTHAYYDGKPFMPNGKAEMNVNPVGNEMQEINWGWPEANHEERLKLYQTYKDNALGYLYYLQHELGKKHLGLPTDEFVDNDFVPYIVYTRECRRIVGTATMTEADINPFILGNTLIPPHQTTSIGVGQYPIDAKPVKTKTDVSTPDKSEGDFYLVNVTSAYQVPYGAMLPQKIDGLLVPTAFSATHVAYSAVRMDPTWVVLGQAAGAAAALSVKEDITPREINLDALQSELVKQDLKLVFYWDVDAAHPQFKAIQLLSVQGTATGDNERLFHPDAPLTRAEAARLLFRAFKLWPSISNVHFTDVPYTHPAFREVETLFDNHVLTVFGINPKWPEEGGYDAKKHAGFQQKNSFGTFEPDKAVTVEEFNALLTKLKGGRDDNHQTPATTDAKTVANTSLTRAEACEILAKFLGIHK